MWGAGRLTGSSKEVGALVQVFVKIDVAGVFLGTFSVGMPVFYVGPARGFCFDMTTVSCLRVRAQQSAFWDRRGDQRPQNPVLFCSLNLLVCYVGGSFLSPLSLIFSSNPNPFHFFVSLFCKLKEPGYNWCRIRCTY